MVLSSGLVEKGGEFLPFLRVSLSRVVDFAPSVN